MPIQSSKYVCLGLKGHHKIFVIKGCSNSKHGRPSVETGAPAYRRYIQEIIKQHYTYLGVIFLFFLFRLKKKDWQDFIVTQSINRRAWLCYNTKQEEEKTAIKNPVAKHPGILSNKNVLLVRCSLLPWPWSNRTLVYVFLLTPDLKKRLWEHTWGNGWSLWVRSRYVKEDFRMQSCFVLYAPHLENSYIKSYHFIAPPHSKFCTYWQFTSFALTPGVTIPRPLYVLRNVSQSVWLDQSWVFRFLIGQQHNRVFPSDLTVWIFCEESRVQGKKGILSLGVYVPINQTNWILADQRLWERLLGLGCLESSLQHDETRMSFL